MLLFLSEDVVLDLSSRTEVGLHWLTSALKMAVVQLGCRPENYTRAGEVDHSLLAQTVDRM